MPFIRADRRKIRYEPQPEAMAVVERLAPRVKQDLIDLAKAFERIDRTTAYVGLGCASIGEFAIRQGLSPFLGRTLRFVGRAFLAFPWVEPALREGQFGFDQAESLGRLASYEGTVREDDDWQTWARFLPLRTLRSKVRRRIEEACQNTRELVPFHTELTRAAFEDYERARILASRMAKKALSRGQTIGAVLSDFNRRHDPQARTPGRRRAGDTSRPGCRTVPAEVLRACIARYGDRCWVPGCTNEIFLENMHRVPKSQGGNQEAPNIDRGCRGHHVIYDAGRMWIIGANEHMLPIFETNEGIILHPDHPGRPLQKSAVQPEEEGAKPSTPPGAAEDAAEDGAEDAQNMAERIAQRMAQRAMVQRSGRRTPRETKARRRPIGWPSRAAASTDAGSRGTTVASPTGRAGPVRGLRTRLGLAGGGRTPSARPGLRARCTPAARPAWPPAVAAWPVSPARLAQLNRLARGRTHAHAHGPTRNRGARCGAAPNPIRIHPPERACRVERSPRCCRTLVGLMGLGAAWRACVSESLRLRGRTSPRPDLSEAGPLRVRHLRISASASPCVCESVRMLAGTDADGAVARPIRRRFLGVIASGMHWVQTL